MGSNRGLSWSMPWRDNPCAMRGRQSRHTSACTHATSIVSGKRPSIETTTFQNPPRFVHCSWGFTLDMFWRLRSSSSRSRPSVPMQKSSWVSWVDCGFGVSGFDSLKAFLIRRKTGLQVDPIFSYTKLHRHLRFFFLPGVRASFSADFFFIFKGSL